jgi:hypothetical protein
MCKEKRGKNGGKKSKEKRVDDKPHFCQLNHFLTKNGGKLW